MFNRLAVFGSLCWLVLLLAACDAATPTAPVVPPTATQPAGDPPTVPPSATVPPATLPASPAAAYPTATQADLQWIDQAFDEVINLKSYHYALQGHGLATSGPDRVDVVGDFVAPNKVHSQGLVFDQQGEFLKTGTQAYAKDANGVWQPTTSTPGGNPAVTLNTLTPDLPLVAGWLDAGSELVQGREMEHFTSPLATAKITGQVLPDFTQAHPSFGTADIWQDRESGYLARIRWDMDLAAMAQAIQAVATATGEQDIPTVGPQKDFFFDMSFSRWNDPAIVIPTP